MNGVIFNQNIMIPTIFHGQMPQQQTQPINDVGNHTVFTNRSPPAGENVLYQPLHFPGFQPFNITISNNGHYYQEPTFTSGSSAAPALNMKTEMVGQQNDLATAVMSALHQNPNTTQIHNLATKESDMSTPNQQISPQSQPMRQSDRSPLGELRLPAIKTTANVAANVMSEEADLGYCSFSDISSLQEISDAMIYSDVSDDMFDDVKSNFSDIIDDVLDSIDNGNFTKSKPILPPLDATPNRVEPSIPEPYNQRMYEQPIKQEYVLSKENYCDQVDIQNVQAFTGFAPPNVYLIPQNVHTNFDVRQSCVDSYCQECDKYFQTKSSLRVHMRQHRGERPHRCPYCQKSFTQKSTLRTHIRTHTGERPYNCQYCARAFSDYSTYRKHVRVHTGEKPYTCDVCQKSFTQSGNMIRHREVHFKKSGDKQKQ